MSKRRKIMKIFAIAIGTPIGLVVIAVAIFRFARKANLINNQVLILADPPNDHKLEAITEVGYMELGSTIRIAMLPGEVFPELAIGGFLGSDQAYLKTEFTLPPIQELVGNDKHMMVFGMTNDAIGYVIPDNDYGEWLKADLSKHYEEIISFGPHTASILLKNFEELIPN